MSFSNPAFLFGLLGAAVPVIIHLINRKKPRRVRFAAITFIQRSVERVSRRFRIRRFLLLAARVAILAAFSLAAARPFFGTEPARATGTSRGPEAVAIVLDASLSMRATYGRETAFDRARTAAGAIVDRLGPEDTATIVLAERSSKVLLPAPTGERSALTRVLADLLPSASAGDLGDAVTVGARELLKGRPPESKTARQVVVLTDLAGHAFRSAAELSGASLSIVDVLEAIEPEERVNHAVIEIEVAPARGRGPRTIDARARVRSFSSASGPSIAAAVTMRGPDGDLVPSTLDLVPGASQDKTFTYAFEDSGTVPISIALDPDKLADDDARFAIAHVRKQVRPLVVDGAPSGVPKEDEIFYLERALLAGADVIAPPAVVTADDLGRTDLVAYDVVILAGVPSLSLEDAARILAFVERGGGLFISAAPGLDVAAYQAGIGRALPRALRGEKRLGDVAGSAPSLGLRVSDPLHPVMSVFSGDAKDGLESTESTAYLLVEPAAERDAEPLLVYDDGQPALLLKRYGTGQVMLLTATVDREFGDLPIRPAFLPLVERSIAFLGNALTRPDVKKTLVGDPRSIDVPDDVVAAEITLPNGEIVRTRRELGAELRVTSTDLPGPYFVSVSRGAALERLPAEDFVVNVDPTESNLTPITVEEAMSTLGSTPKKSEAKGRFASLAGASSTDLAAGLMLALLFAFLAESLLSISRDGRAKTRG
ncbi:MAG: BatA domain-containing protein [Deltaproteobacteria bacterium]|nr:BatA domain-containing protein [Deltaproteobacteria bacterium]